RGPSRKLTDLLRESDQVHHRLRAELLHHAAAVHLDGLLRRPELGGDALVRVAERHQREDLALPRREGGQSTGGRLADRSRLAPRAPRGPGRGPPPPGAPRGPPPSGEGRPPGPSPPGGSGTRRPRR